MRTTKKPPLAEALFWAIGLSLLFFAVYSSTNIFTSFRHDVGQSFMQWELKIPFVPLLMIPYMSIDLLFFLSPFLCRTQDELRTHGKRIAMAILIAGVCFVLFPLTAGFVRPQVTGWLGSTFRTFWLMDRPYNLAPSLHIALWAILWAVYGRVSRGAVRISLGIWFVFIGLSTLLTYQHQVIDLILGYLLAGFCFAVFPDQSTRRKPTGNSLRIARLFGAGAILILAVMLLVRPRAMILLWPVFTLACVSCAYCGGGPGIFAKREGRRSAMSVVFLWPYMAGVRVSIAMHNRHPKRWARVGDSVLIGGILSNRRARELIAVENPSAVLDLTCEVSESKLLRKLPYKNIQILDLTAPAIEDLQEAVEFIQQNQSRGSVFVHCAMGRSRSVCVAAAYLLAGGFNGSVEEALDVVRRARPEAVINSDSIAALKAFAQTIISSEV